MANPEHEKVVRRGAKAIGEWRAANPDTAFDLSDADLDEAGLGNADLRGADLSNASLRGANLSNADLDGASLRGADLTRAHMSSAILTTASLVGATLREASFQSARLTGAILRRTDLREAVFHRSVLRGTDLRDVEVDAKTYFGDADMRGCLIDRFTVEYVRERSEWNTSDLLGMKITDGLATLRGSFGGAFAWLHVAGLVGFVAPYVWFCVAHWSISDLRPSEGERVTLLEALGQYVVSGGKTWGTWDPAAFWILVFSLLLFYNVARFLLLMETKRREIQEIASGLPVKFSLRGKWRFWYEFSRIGLWLSLALAVVHTVRFLLHEIPVPPDS